MVTADILEAFVRRPSVRAVVGGCSSAVWALLVLSSCGMAADHIAIRIVQDMSVLSPLTPRHHDQCHARK